MKILLLYGQRKQEECYPNGIYRTKDVNFSMPYVSKLNKRPRGKESTEVR